MTQRNQPRSQQARNNQKTRDPKRWRTYALMFVCALMLVSGFFFAGRQHFSSMDFGMKNSRLRKQIDELESEKRRLLLAREVSLSPGEIKRVAKKVGILGEAGPETEVSQVMNVTKEKVVPVTASAKPMIIKTAAVTPANPPASMAYVKTAKLTSQVKRSSAAE